ncbi:RCC1 domain-containing protein [Streptomyces sp. yr375]|uniref:RCC1 domain-containing protein n=1 Tax=Streptomyces sp. yr375 TaxID=1761906 RepID=UPI00116087C5|nr:RCC1 domain-containing protein [Streptomyces sp. yr375]
MRGTHTWVPPEITRGGVTGLACADENWNIAVRHGRVVEWDTKQVVQRFPVREQGKIVAVAAGGPDFAAALSSTGKVIVWGRAGLPEMLERCMPQEVRDGTAPAIAAGPDHLVAVVSGAVFWWGDWDGGGEGRASCTARPSTNPPWRSPPGRSTR